MALKMLSILALSLLYTLSSSCEPPNCDNVDCGTCVEACCKLEWNVTGSDAESVSNDIESLLKSGGPDGQYSYFGTTLDQGPLSYVVQGIHSTATMHYNDTLNFGMIYIS